MSSCYSKTLKEKLLRVNDLTLEKCLEIGKSKELAKKQANEMAEENKNINQVNKYQRKNRLNPCGNQNKSNKNNNRKSNKKCFRCGETFDPTHKEKCKAIGKTCYNCQKKNHLSKCCNASKKEIAKRVEKGENISESDAETDDSYESFAVSTKKQTASGMITIANVNIKMIIDSGSSLNLIDRKTWEKIKKENKSVELRPTKTKIFPYFLFLTLK